MMTATDPVYGYEQTFSSIVQGSTYPDLRKESAEFIAAQYAGYERDRWPFCRVNLMKTCMLWLSWYAWYIVAE